MSDDWRGGASQQVEGGISWKVQGQSCQPFAPSVTIYLTHSVKLVSLWEIIMEEKLHRVAHDSARLIHEIKDFERVFEDEIKEKGKDFNVSASRLRKVGAPIAQQSMELVNNLSLHFANVPAFRLTFLGESPMSARELLHQLKNVRQTVLQDLHRRSYIPATEDMLKYWNESRPFGDAVACAFMECSEDISEACNCFAFERYTACVFHLGRAMEQATARLAKRLKVGRPDDDWQGYLRAINKAIDAMPYGTKKEREKRAPYAEAAGLSFQFKEAWRNPTAHPKRTYTREEALDVMNGARAFMDAMARKILKVRIVPEPF